MKALSIHPLYCEWIFFEEKTVECRTWETKYRGDLLICSTAKLQKGTIPGHALCVAKITDIVPFQKKHCKPAKMPLSAWQPGMYAWMLEDIRAIQPFKVKGKLGLWNCDHEIKYLGEQDMSLEEWTDTWNKWYLPLYI